MEGPVSLPQLCYDIAYFILPHYVFKDFDKLSDLCLNTPHAAGPFFYLMAAGWRKMEPNIEDGKLFLWHLGQLRDGRDYFALRYPVPPPVDLQLGPIEPENRGRALIVLAPHFSAVIRDRQTANVQYFILGQAPLGGGTTFRSILPDATNCNLGPGPQPDLAAFLERIEDRLAP